MPAFLAVRSGSIRRKILAVTILTMTVGLVLAGGAISVFDAFDHREHLVADLTTVSRVIGENSVAALAFDDSASATSVMKALDLNDDIVAACVLDRRGRILARYGDSLTLSRTPLGTVTEEGYYSWGDDILLWRPIQLENERIGTLYIAGSLRVVKERLYKHFILVSIVLLCCASLAVILTAPLRRAIVDPIFQLARVAERVAADGDYSVRASKTNDDETGVLVDGFNRMLDEIEDRDRALQLANDELEARVESRTAELRLAKEAAEEAVRAKSEFLANISHELRTPMHAVLSFSSIGREKTRSGPPEKIEGFFDRIHQSGSRLLALLNNLLDLSKLDAGKMPMEFRPAELRPLALGVVEELRGLSAAKGIVITVEGQIEDRVPLDAVRIVQVFQNLIGNAIKFTPQDGRIVVRLERVDTHVQVTVEDDGIGIPDDDINAIFDKFIQSRKTKSGAGGTGLGLSICREIILAHEGQIWAEPGRAKGSAICFRLPATSDEVQDPVSEDGEIAAA